MDGQFDRLKPNLQIREEAAEWLIQFNADSADAAARAQFDEWLRTSPEHIRAYIELLPLWHDSTSLAEVNQLSRDALIALGTRRGTNVTSLSHAAETGRDAPAYSVTSRVERKQGVRIARNGQFFAVAALILIGFALIPLIYRMSHAGEHRYRTGIAEVRSVTLEDGTKLSIGAKSVVAVRYTDAARTFYLEGGDIYVDVAKDAARPFLVEVKDKVIRALGTQFEVRADERTMRVAVIEGAVSVSQGGSNAVFLRAGQQLTARQSESLKAPQPLRSKEPAAWRTGRLVFDDANLGDVVREFNRYNVKQLQLVDRSLETIPIAAAFSSADPGALIRFLQDQPGITVTVLDGEILVEAQ
jgi:transmembrane sensor